MVNENLIPKVEEIREIKYEIPTYEEFMKTYQANKRVNDSYESEINSLERGYGPCQNVFCGCDCSSYECNCPSAEASIYKNGGFSIGNYSASGKGGVEDYYIKGNGQASRSLFRVKDHTGDLKILSDSLEAEIGPNQEGYAAKVRASADVISFKSGGFEGRAGLNLEVGYKHDSDNVEVKAGIIGVTIGKKLGLSTPVGEIKVDTEECVIQ